MVYGHHKFGRNDRDSSYLTLFCQGTQFRANHQIFCLKEEFQYNNNRNYNFFNDL